MKKNMKIWGIVQGPISVRDLPGQDYPDGAKWYHECRVEIDGEMDVVPYWFYDLDSAYEMKKHFDTTIEPLEIKINYGELYDA